ncbi:phosphoglycerate mutase [Immersiella caudata]|uniref:Phosphoglycerate mutase n=1 Tax=Immersiella caudata TaxID=314043 RepID=A0AA39X5S7_9PEZI|nr:phosphoglycerate mutase [Immersiella caudata]
MRRALQTALTSLDWLTEAGIKVAPDARWQENSTKNWNTGTPVPSLAEEFSTLDFSSLDLLYPDKTSPAGSLYFYTRDAILNRAQVALRDLYNRPEKLILVVSHEGFLKAGVSGKTLANGDYRVFEFIERRQDGEPDRLKEWEVTACGGARGLSPDIVVELGEGLPE